MNDYRFHSIQIGRATFLLLALAGAISAQIATGGDYKLAQTVVASGGGASKDATNNVYKIEGTTGQSAAGTQSNSMLFSVKGGFWTAPQFAPTAAVVNVGGRATTADGRGIRNVLVTLTDASGESRTVLSGAFGNYRFADVPAGATYLFSIAAKRYTFAQSTQIRSITEDTNDINFVANN